MRRLATVCLGLALSAPTSAWSQDSGPTPDLTLQDEQNRLAGLEAPEYQQVKQELQQAQAMGMGTYYGGHVCESCARKLPNRIEVDPSVAPTGVFGRHRSPSLATYRPGTYAPSPAPMMASESPNGGCTMCQQGQMAGNAPAPTAYPSNPGVAYVGGPTQTAGVAYLGGPSGSDGNARYLGVVGSIEPVPVGVVRTNYNQVSESSPSSGGMTPAPYDPYMQKHAMTPPTGPVPQAPMGAPMAYPGHRRTSVLGHMLGFGRHRPLNEARRQQEKESHAMIRYNSTEAGPTQMPASMVYPR